MRKILDNKLIMMPLIIVFAISGALVMFAPSTIRSEPNKGLPFKAVKLCVTKPVQLILQQVIKSVLSAIPYVGYLFKAIPTKYYPVPCSCGDNIYDSAPSPMAIKENPFDFIGLDIEIPIIDYKLTQNTQKLLEEKLTKELVPRYQEAEKQQAAMIKTETPEGPDVILEAYKKLREGLINANALAYTDRFEAEFKNKFPDYKFEKLSKTELEFAQLWRAVIDEWMRGLNVIGRNFQDEQNIRNTLVNQILKSYISAVDDIGQTQSLQMLAALAAQANAITERSMMEWNGLFEACLECVQHERDFDASIVENVVTIGANGANTTRSSTGTKKLGF